MEQILLTDEEIENLCDTHPGLEVSVFDLMGLAAKDQLKKVGEDLGDILEDVVYQDHRISAVYKYLEALLQEAE